MESLKLLTYTLGEQWLFENNLDLRKIWVKETIYTVEWRKGKYTDPDEQKYELRQ